VWSQNAEIACCWRELCFAIGGGIACGACPTPVHFQTVPPCILENQQYILTIYTLLLLRTVRILEMGHLTKSILSIAGLSEGRPALETIPVVANAAAAPLPDLSRHGPNLRAPISLPMSAPTAPLRALPDFPSPIRRNGWPSASTLKKSRSFISKIC
jgi:hypothetical protein